ncbi:MAG: hypothetical protein WAL66_15365, partial [Nitrososphaeraceae archaeon]
FIPGLMWFFDRYLKLLLLSYIPSANIPFRLLFSEALSTNFHLHLYFYPLLAPKANTIQLNHY